MKLHFQKILVIGLLLSGAKSFGETQLNAAVKPSKKVSIVSTVSNSISTSEKLRFYELAHLADLPHSFDPEAMGFESLFHLAATNKGLKKSILLRSDRQLSPQWTQQVFSHPRGFFAQMNLLARPVLIFFEGFREDEVTVLMTKFRAQYTGQSEISSRLPASETVAVKSEESPTPSTAALVTESFERCGKATADGFWDPFVSAAKAAELGVRDPSKLWSNTLKDWDRFKEAFRKLEISTPVTKLKEIWEMPAAEQSKAICHLIGGSMSTGAVGVKAAQAIVSKTAIKGTAEAASSKAVSESSAPTPGGAAIQPEVAPAVALKKLPTFHYSPEEVAGVRAKYKQLAQRIDQNTAEIQNTKIGPETFSEKLPDDLAARLKTLDPRLKNTMEAIWGKLSDSQAFANYLKTLSEDAAVEMSKRASASDLTLMGSGELSRSALLKVLVKRFKAEGNDQFSTVTSQWNDKNFLSVKTPIQKKTKKIDTNDGFREAVHQGPFFDKPFKTELHGMDHHFLQLNYVADVVWKETQGNPRLFWDFIGSKQGIRYWSTLFDDRGTTFSCPEYIGEVLKNRMPFK